MGATLYRIPHSLSPAAAYHEVVLQLAAVVLELARPLTFTQKIRGYTKNALLLISSGGLSAHGQPPTATKSKGSDNLRPFCCLKSPRGEGCRPFVQQVRHQGAGVINADVIGQV